MTTTSSIHLPQAHPRHVDGLVHVTPDVAGLQVVMVNVYFVGNPDRWVLVDAALPMSAGRIRRAAEARFGAGSRPQAIILTHGHFDHVGALPQLADEWHVPIYAHRLEMPYLTGKSDYPPPDPTVGGGLMARSSPLFPHHGYDFGGRVRELPADGSVPGMDGWRRIHTPGHSPGHISLFRDSDRALIAGDAFVTQKQESFFAVMSNRKKVHGPPRYLTMDWHAAKRSVQALAELQPSVAATGHGLPMAGDRLGTELTALAFYFDELAVPKSGRYVIEPAVADETGVVFLPPPAPDPALKVAAAVVAAGATAAVIAAIVSRRSRRDAAAASLADRLGAAEYEERRERRRRAAELLHSSRRKDLRKLDAYAARRLAAHERDETRAVEPESTARLARRLGDELLAGRRCRIEELRDLDQ